jgi:large subunit ribosomal protein L21
MYAVVKQGSKQYKVEEGDVILVDCLHLDKGASYIFEEVLAKEGQIGSPYVDGASVSVTVLEPEVKDKKVYTLKYRRRKASSKSLKGHRQKYTRVRVEKIA